MKPGILLIPLFFFLPAAAQHLAPDGPPVAATPYAQQASADTVRALQKLFNNRRTRGGVLLGVTGGAIVTANVVVSSDLGLVIDAEDGALLATGIALLYTAPLWVVGISQRVRFIRRKEQQVIDEFRAAHVLPRKILKRLKPALFTHPSRK